MRVGSGWAMAHDPLSLSLFFLEMYRTESVSVVIVGGKHVDISLALQIFVKCMHFSQRRFFHNVFDMFRRNTAFLGCRRVDVAYDSLYN